MAGVIITYLGWQSNFYITGCLSLLVALLWIVLVFDTPKECPRISAEELKFIFDNTIQDEDEMEQEKNLVPPYFAMLKSVKAWAGVSSNLKFEGISTNVKMLLMKFCRLYQCSVTSWAIISSSLASQFI